MNNKVLILGAGPSGMAAAFELHKAGVASTVVEKNDRVGGLGRTLHFGEFTTDIGPHRFFSKNRYLYDLIEDLLGEHWIKVDRYTRFYIDYKFYDYPIEIKNALLNVGLSRAMKILLDYTAERIKDRLSKRNLESFEDYTVANFGRSLAELNMLNYTEKIWGLPCKEISPEWATQRIKGLSLIEVVKNSIFGSKQGPKTLVDQFYYPDMGTGMIYESIKDRVFAGKDNGNKIMLDSYPVEIRHTGNKISSVTVKSKDNEEILAPEQVISSIPITELIKLLEPAAPADVLSAGEKLKYRAHVSLLLTLDCPSIFPDQWVYFPNMEIPYARIMEPKNFSKKLSPENKTSLLIEFFCWENDRTWNAGLEELTDMSVTWLEKTGFIKKSQIMDSYIVHKDKFAYPVYDLFYKAPIQKIKNYLGNFENLQCVGRAGSFRYNNQDHALEDGHTRGQEHRRRQKERYRRYRLGTGIFRERLCQVK